MRAMEAFWANGYDATSLDDLMSETGLSRSSLYNAFGDKLDLFIAALGTYARGPARDVMEPLVTGHGASALREFLRRLSSFVESPAACRGWGPPCGGRQCRKRRRCRDASNLNPADQPTTWALLSSPHLLMRRKQS